MSTFDELVLDTCDRLNYTSSDATIRVGRAINRKYKEVTSSINLIVGRRTEVSTVVTMGVRQVVFSGIEKLIAVIDKSSGANRYLGEDSYEEVFNASVAASDLPQRFAVDRQSSRTVTILLDSLPQTAYTLYAEGLETKVTLSGTDEPSFPESFHDILVEGAMADEYRKLDKQVFFKEAQAQYQKRLAELQYFLVKSSYQDILQNKHSTSGLTNRMGGVGGSDVTTGGLSYTQQGLITFDRDPLAPFAVSSGSAVVPNLIATSATSATTAGNVTTGWTSVTFDSGNFTANNGGGWVVELADQVTFDYMILGKTLFLAIEIDSYTVSGAPTQLKLTVPAGQAFTSIGYFTKVALSSDAGTVTGDAYARVINATQLGISLANGGVWTAGLNNSLIAFQGFFRIL